MTQCMRHVRRRKKAFLPGGGVALLVRSSAGETQRRKRGSATRVEIVRSPGLAGPQIAINAGADGSVCNQQDTRSADLRLRFDAQTGEFRESGDQGIIDPTRWFERPCRMPRQSRAC